MAEKHDEQTLETENELSVAERNKIQQALIEDFCRIKEIEDPIVRNTCAIEWIEKYADNFDQLDKALIDEYRQAGDDNRRKIVLDEIQKALEKLNELNG